MKLSLIAICLVVAAVAVAGSLNKDEEELSSFYSFTNFQREFGRQYADSTEQALRFAIFKDNMATAAKLNAQHNGQAKFGASPFADLTPAEFRERYIMKNFTVPLEVTKATPWIASEHNLGAYPANLDWRNYNGKNTITAVQDQGQCGCCWAFASCGELEAHYLRLFGQTWTFSPQQLIDCDTVDSGCEGGNPINAFAYMAKNGVMLWSDYPYAESDQGCSYDGTKAYGYPNSARYTAPQKPAANLFSFISTHGPATAALDSSQLQLYQSGVLNVPDAQCPNADHAVLIVGYNSALNYFIVKNSWSTDWGIQGFFYINTGSCVVGNMISGMDPPSKAIPTS